MRRHFRFDVGLAIEATQRAVLRRMIVQDVEFVGGVLALGGIVGDAVWVGALDAGSDPVHIERVLRLGEAAGEFVQRLALMQMQQE